MHVSVNLDVEDAVLDIFTNIWITGYVAISCSTLHPCSDGKPLIKLMCSAVCSKT